MHIRDAHAVNLTDVYARPKEKEGKGNFRKNNREGGDMEISRSSFQAYSSNKQHSG